MNMNRFEPKFKLQLFSFSIVARHPSGSREPGDERGTTRDVARIIRATLPQPRAQPAVARSTRTAPCRPASERAPGIPCLRQRAAWLASHGRRLAGRLLHAPLLSWVWDGARCDLCHPVDAPWDVAQPAAAALDVGRRTTWLASPG